MELVVVMGIIGLMTLGTTTMVTNLLKTSKKTLLITNLIAIKNNLIANIKNEDAWLATVTNSAGVVAQTNMRCLETTDNTPCNDGLLFEDIALYGRPGFTGVPPAPLIYDGTIASLGYNLEGEICNSFNEASPNDSCPFRYEFDVNIECPNGNTDCLRPNVRVTGELRVFPASDSSLAYQINPAEYAIDVYRNQEEIYEPLQIVHAEVGGTGGGACTPGSYVRRPLTRKDYDFGDNAALNTATNQFVLQAGLYECKVMAQAHEPLSGFKVRLNSGGTTFNIGSGISFYGNTNEIKGAVDLNLASATTVSLEHICYATITPPQWATPGPYVPKATDFGRPSSDASIENIYSRITCVRKQ